jgi:hypothetical protein
MKYALALASILILTAAAPPPDVRYMLPEDVWVVPPPDHPPTLVERLIPFNPTPDGTFHSNQYAVDVYRDEMTRHIATFGEAAVRRCFLYGMSVRSRYDQQWNMYTMCLTTSRP